MNKKESIRNLQGFLRNISQHSGEVTSVIPDGFFGPRTEESLKSFQSAYGLPVTGVADYETWNKVVSVNDFLVSTENEPDCISALPSYALPMSPGKESPYVYLLQGILTVLSVNGGFEKVEISGIYDEKTESAIKRIQHISGISGTGITDRETWNALAGLYSAVLKKNN